MPRIMQLHLITSNQFIMLNQLNKITCKGKTIGLEKPIVMGILNVTPDSFFDGGKYERENDILKQAEKMLDEGATILDIGAMSSRPGAVEISEKEELQRLLPAIHSILKEFPETILSIDTYRSGIAKKVIDTGAAIINDISGGQLDDKMFETVGKLQVPYILMHMKGNPQNMQQSPDYEDVTLEIFDWFTLRINELKAAGVKEIILDPGFGFGKTVAHNYELLQKMHVFAIHDLPVLAGISRKSMIYKILENTAQEALNGTSVLHLVALNEGAKILRVHDVKEAKEVIKLWEVLKENKKF